MPCRTSKFIAPSGDVVTVIACSRGREGKCSVCGGPATKLCDFPMAGPMQGKTCDRPLCLRHAKSVGPNIDYCPAHARAEAGKEEGK